MEKLAVTSRPCQGEKERLHTLFQLRNKAEENGETDNERSHQFPLHFPKHPLLMAFTLAHTQGLVANVLPYNSGYLDECWVSGKSSFTVRTPTSAAENHPNGSRFLVLCCLLHSGLSWPFLATSPLFQPLLFA